MSNFSKLESHAEAHKKFGKPKALRQPGSGPTGRTEMFVGNLPMDIKEVAIAVLFKDFGVKSVKKYTPHGCGFSYVFALGLPDRSVVGNKFQCITNDGAVSFSFVELTSPELARSAVQQLNGSLWNGRRITVAIMDNQQFQKAPPTNTVMPDLEPISFDGLNGDAPQFPSLKQEVIYAVPMEMRSLFLLQMSKDCFKDTAWLFSATKLRGKAGLLVMDTVPQAPYFWAIHMTEECSQNMVKLFTALAKAESKLPFLAKEDVRPGMRCLAKCRIGAEGNDSNRCLVLAKGKDLGLVFFMDYGRSAMVPLDSLQKLEGDEFWTINPLGQPFVLQEGVFPREVMMRQILEGVVVGPLDMEPHILKFAVKPQ